MFPGVPLKPFPMDGDTETVKRYMLDLLDESPDRRAIITFDGPGDQEDALDRLEERFRDGYEAAKVERPDLGVRILPAASLSPGASAFLVELHEHQWVGGYCVRNCGAVQEAA